MNIFDKLYLQLFGIKRLRKANDKILKLALKVRGFNNFEDHRVSGEQHLIDNVLKQLAPKVCVDVGANSGQFSRTLLQSTGASVYAFEPLQQPFAELAAIQSEFPGRLVAVNKGVGAQNGKLTLHYSDSATTHASFAPEVKHVSYVSNEKRTDVDVISLDSYFESQSVDSLDFLKIDTEGFEYEVLEGAQTIIGRYKPKLIQIEWNWHQMFRRQSMFMISQLLPDYSLYQLLPADLVERDPRDPLSNLYQYSNFVFIRSDLKTLG